MIFSRCGRRSDVSSSDETTSRGREILSVTTLKIFVTAHMPAHDFCVWREPQVYASLRNRKASIPRQGRAIFPSGKICLTASKENPFCRGYFLLLCFLKNYMLPEFLTILSKLKLLLSCLFVLSSNVRTCAFCSELYEFIL